MASSAEAEEVIPYESHTDQKSLGSFDFILCHEQFDKYVALREASCVWQRLKCRKEFAPSSRLFDG